jgi:outer membrane lipoprotein-sorting protein
MARSIATALTRRRLAWLVPLAVGGLVVAGAAIESSGASAPPRLRPYTTAQLVAAARMAPDTALSGKITETANLGLPDLPGDAQDASLSWQSFLTGTHSVRVWTDGPAKQRLAVLGQLSEADIVHNGRNLWTYTSDTNTVSHTVLPEGARSNGLPSECGPLHTPQQVAAQLLKAIAPSTSVALGPNTTVAGRSAYTLDIAPRDARSTIRRITIAIDSVYSVPLQVTVYGASSTPAIKIGFTEVSFGSPAASTFAFHVPAGATVSKNPFAGNRAEHTPAVPQHAPAMRPRLIGSHWTSVLELHNAGGVAAGAGLLQQLTTPVGGSGMRLLHTALINAVVLPDGRAFIGALRPAALEHIATTTAG